MYKYAGVDTGADALIGFAREGYKSTAAQDVPKEISPLDIALKQLRGNASYVSPSTPALQDILNLLSAPKPVTCLLSSQLQLTLHAILYRLLGLQHVRFWD